MIKRLLAALSLLAAVAGCDAAWLPRTVITVDPDALAEVRSVGRVVTRTFVDPMYERTVQVIEVLVVDMRATGFLEALDLARTRLERLGWSEVGSTDVSVQMESSRWEGTTTTLDSVEELDALGARLEPTAGEALRADPKKWANYIVVSLSSVNESVHE